MKHFNRYGQIEYSEDSGAYFEECMDKAPGKIMWANLGVCFAVGCFAASGLYIGVVAFVNWVMS